MKENYRLFKQSFMVLKKYYPRFIGYRIISSFVVILLLLPLLQMAFNWLMHMRGYSYIANGLINKFIMSPQGIIMAIISLTIGSIVVLIEIGGMVVIANQSIVGSSDSRFIDIALFSLKRIKYLFGIDGVILCLYFIIIGPLLDSNTKSCILNNLQVPNFLIHSIQSNGLTNFLLILSIILITYFTYRWFFAVHFLILRDDPSKRFLKQSRGIRRGHNKKLVQFIFFNAVMQIVVLLTGLILLGALLWGASRIINLEEGAWVILFIMFSTVGTVVLGTFITSITIIQTTYLFEEFSHIPLEPLEIKVHHRGTIFNRFIGHKGLSIFTLAAGIMAIIITSITYYESYVSVVYDVEITAHRGSSLEAPENTLAAIKKAVENGADYAEIDIQLTKDHEIILLHDEDFKRTNDVNLRPQDMTLNEISNLAFGVCYSDGYPYEPVPTLQTVVDYAQGKIKLNIEIKGSKENPLIVEELIKLIDENDYENECLVTSVNINDLLLIEEKAPYIKTGYILYIAAGDIHSLPIDVYSVEGSLVSEALVEEAHKRGREVHAWTINDIVEMQRMIELGVDNIITDHDRDMKNLLASQKEGITWAYLDRIRID